MRFDLLLLASVLLLSCGPGLHDLDLGTEPIATVKGRIDPGVYASRASGAPLHAVLVWAGVSEPNYACHLYGHHPELTALCPDPLRFTPMHVERHVPVGLGGDGRFEIPIHALPGSQVVVGDAKGRVAYGSVLIVEDTDRNGVPEPLGTFSGASDRVIGASFRTLSEPQTRIVFREGNFDEESYFFPAPGCPAPPQGFSILHAPEYRPEAPVEGCRLDSLEVEIEPALLTTGQQRAYSCPVWHAITPPPPEFFDVAGMTCLDPETVLMIHDDGACPMAVVMPLVGCYASPCNQPHWDLRADVPEWWPC